MTLAHATGRRTIYGQSRKLGGSESQARGPGQQGAPASRPSGGQKSGGPSRDEARSSSPCRAPSGGSPGSQASASSSGSQASGGSSGGEARCRTSGGQASGGSSGGEARRRTSGVEENSGQEAGGRRHQTDGARIQGSQSVGLGRHLVNIVLLKERMLRVSRWEPRSGVFIGPHVDPVVRSVAG
jgi:hypothetical protein